MTKVGPGVVERGRSNVIRVERDEYLGVLEIVPLERFYVSTRPRFRNLLRFRQQTVISSVRNRDVWSVRRCLEMGRSEGRTRKGKRVRSVSPGETSTRTGVGEYVILEVRTPKDLPPGDRFPVSRRSRIEFIPEGVLQKGLMVKGKDTEEEGGTTKKVS